MDAVAYPLPNECLICYFFNPFDETLITQMLANIRESLLKNPREIFIVYYNPRESHIIDQADCFSRVGTIGCVSIWRTTQKSHENKE
jgi:hypothetical protein